ncbi:MAG: nucleotide sugar dehydrogenase [Candidatus Hydrogenedentota bacterium]
MPKRWKTVSVVGMGYVGLPLAVIIAKKGYKVYGIDLDHTKVRKINKGINYISDVDNNDLKEVVNLGLLRAYDNYKPVSKSDIIIIAVPTPIDKNMQPDLSCVISAACNVAKYLRKNTVVVLESTTFPGTTDELLKPILEKSGLVIGKDFYLGFSPERVDPGNKVYKIENTPKIISGITKSCLKRIKEFYDTIIVKTIPVSSTKVAEMAKLLENIYRNVNIALVNEIMLLCDRMGIDIWEVIEAACTKPFGFMKFNPGPGVGGHCIPIDPFYLSYKAKEHNFFTNFINLSAEVNENIPYFVVNKILRELAKRGLTPKRSSVLVLGLTFKKDVADLRHSPACKIIELMLPYGFRLFIHDPYFKSVCIKDKELKSVNDPYNVANKVDFILILTDHSVYRWDDFARRTKGFVFDTRNATKNIKSKKIVKL